MSKLSLSDKLAITLGYYRECRPMRNIAWVEEVLAQSKEFTLPSKRELTKENAPFVVLMDVTECEIQRPKKTEKVLHWKKEKTYDKDSGDIQSKHERYNLF